MIDGNPRKGNHFTGKIPLHPFLFASYFVLALLGFNIAQAQPYEAIQSLIVVLALTGGMLIILRIILKDWLNGALVVSLVMILFFTYGHVYHYLESNNPVLGRHRLLIPIWIVLAVIGLWLIIKRSDHPAVLTTALNITALVALVFPIYQIINWEIKIERVVENPERNKSEITDLHLTPGKSPPDVYFFVLDMYGRQDILKEVYNIDNTVLINDLKQMGFEIAECSQSNYSQTEMALTSVMNMNYLDALGHFDPSTVDSLALRGLIKQNLVMQAFRDMGYKLVSFKTGFHFSEFYNADYYLSPDGVNRIQFGKMNNFELMLLKSTAALVLYDTAKVLPAFLESGNKDPLESKREQVLFTLDKLDTISDSISGPKFVFAHILVLHEPFVFSPDGQAVDYPENMDEEGFQAAYRDQLIFLNSRLLPILQNIIDRSNPKPIIILQGDTGPGLVSHSGHMANLSAFYLPGNEGSIPPAITPVNDFRLVLDRYFGADLDLLPDYSYFSLYTSPFDFEPVPNNCIPGYR